MAQVEMAVESLGMILVDFGALVQFVTDSVPIDVTAIGIMIALIVLGPWTRLYS